jgi:putative flippase GtrA
MIAMERATGRQIVRFAVIGLISNGVLYVLYLALARAGLSPAMAMSIAYSLGVAQTFAFNRRWTFSYAGLRLAPLVRYLIAYALGYVINLAILVVFAGRLGLAHQPVQAVAILVVAAVVFALQKHWVFRTERA